jgi:hypothetical protein
MATQVVELTGDEASLLRSLDNLIKKQVEYENKLRSSGEVGDAAGIKLEGALAKVQAESDKALRGMLTDLRSLGPEGAAMAEAMKGHFTETGKAGFRSIETILAKVRELDPAAAAAAESAGAKLQEELGNAARVSEAQFDDLARSLRSLGPEGAAAADAMKGHFAETGKSGQQSMELILNQLREMDPAAAAAASAAAAKIKQELGDAARYSEGEFGKVLTELRALGPEGKQAADQLRKHLVDSGQIAQKSMRDIVAELAKINPEVALVGRNIVDGVSKGENKFKEFGKSAVAQVSGIALSYFGLQEAIGAVNNYLALQRDLIQQAADAQANLAKAQQDASKNLAALSPEQRKDLLSQVPAIAQQAGFGDLNAITTALGTVASTGVDDPQQIINAVIQSAKLERLSPENLPSTAAGAVDVQTKTGLADIRQALALIASTGTQSLVSDPEKLAANLPKALGAGIATAPQQDVELAARETAALYALVTTAGTDSQGMSSATFTIDFVNRMSQFFGNIQTEQITARSKIELIDRQIANGSDTELDRLNRSKLQDFLAASEGVSDPGTQFGRLQLLQNNPALSSAFAGPSGFGEQQFKPVLSGLLDASSKLAANLQTSVEKIQASTQAFDLQAAELENATPQLSIANFQARQQGVLAAQAAASGEAAMLSSVRTAGAATLQTTLPRGFQGFFSNLTDTTAVGGLDGSTSAEEAVSLVAELLNRADLLRSDGIQADDERKLAVIDQTIGNLSQLIAQNAESLDPEGVTRAQKRAQSFEQTFARDNRAGTEVFTEMKSLLERIAKSNEAMQTAPPPPIPTPSVTPALSASQP